MSHAAIKATLEQLAELAASRNQLDRLERELLKELAMNCPVAIGDEHQSHTGHAMRVQQVEAVAPQGRHLYWRLNGRRLHTDGRPVGAKDYGTVYYNPEDPSHE